jgi:endonuclease G
VAIALVAGLFYLSRFFPFPVFIPTGGENLLLGNPSQATAVQPDNYLMTKRQYVLSYNRDRGTANWVSWQLDRHWLGDTDRQDDFRPDESLPRRWPRVNAEAYAESGYDRGHLIPSADRTDSVADNSATFLMTNIVPQTAENNRGPWRELEEYCRNLVDRGYELYIVAGVYGTQDHIGAVTVPSHLWKAIAVLKPGDGLKGASAQTPIIAVDMPNAQQLDANWQTYRVSVDDLEAKTGYDLLSRLPTSLQAELERRTPSSIVLEPLHPRKS